MVMFAMRDVDLLVLGCCYIKATRQFSIKNEYYIKCDLKRLSGGEHVGKRPNVSLCAVCLYNKILKS